MIDRRTLLGAGAALAAVPAAAATGGRWRTGAPLPFAVQEIYPALWRGRLVVGGGFRARGPGFVADLGALWPTAAVVAMRPGARAWEALPDLPDRRHHPLLAAQGDRLLAVGGFSSAPGALWRMHDQCWVLTPGARRWVDGPALPIPMAEVAAGVLADGSLLVAGGRTPREGGANAAYGDHRDTGAAFLLRPGASRWEASEALPTPRNSAAAAIVEGRLHVVAGRTLTAEGITNLVVHEAWDPRSRRWEVRAALPAPRGGHAAAVLGGRLHVFGGEAFRPSPTVFGEVFAYDPARDHWDEVARMPEPRHGLGAVPAGSAIHLLGGAAEAGGRATRPAHDIFRP